MLTVSKLVVRHPGFHLGPVSFSAAPGEFVCVVGPNAVSYTHLDVYKRQT